MALPFVTERKAEQITKEVIKEGGITGGSGSSNVLILHSDTDMEALEIEDQDYDNWIIKKDFNIDDITEIVIFRAEYVEDSGIPELYDYSISHNPLTLITVQNKWNEDKSYAYFFGEVIVFELEGEWHLKISKSEVNN